jgi:predicted RNA-binding Zn-ribbon protein involved in translation (DUF1610 family)
MGDAPGPDDRVEIPQDAFLRTTRQLWKLIVAGLVLPWPAVLIGWWAFRQIGPDQSTGDLLVAIGAMAAIAAAIAALFASVRCPQCGGRLLRRLWSDPEGLNALTAFLKARTCPACGHDPRARSAAGRANVDAR